MRPKNKFEHLKPWVKMGLEINSTWPSVGQMSFETTVFLKYGIPTKIMTKAKT